jgi:PiT family inorganic phosphate transporter
MTIFKLPASLSQIAIGAIIGIGFATQQSSFVGLNKILICWALTPVTGAVITLILYYPIGWIFKKLPLSIFSQDYLIRRALVITCCYGAYALGANNVASVTSVYVTSGMLSPLMAILIGSLSIAIGVFSCRKAAMFTVGSKLIRLDPYTALIVVFSEALAVHIFAWIGVPVSTSQALTGAILGIGILKGMQTIKLKTLLLMLVGWICTPAVAAILAFATFSFLQLF